MDKKSSVMESKLIVIIIAIVLFFAMIGIYLLMKENILDIDVFEGVFK